jgi:hypothetical protein
VITETITRKYHLLQVLIHSSKEMRHIFKKVQIEDFGLSIRTLKISATKKARILNPDL